MILVITSGIRISIKNTFEAHLFEILMFQVSHLNFQT